MLYWHLFNIQVVSEYFEFTQLVNLTFTSIEKLTIEKKMALIYLFAY